MGKKTNYEKIKEIMKSFIQKIFIALLILQLSTIYVRAEIVNKIDIKGNSRVSDETVKVYGNIMDLGSNFSKKDLDQILKNLYSTNFFKEINIEIKNNTLFLELT